MVVCDNSKTNANNYWVYYHCVKIYVLCDKIKHFGSQTALCDKPHLMMTTSIHIRLIIPLKWSPVIPKASNVHIVHFPSHVMYYDFNAFHLLRTQLFITENTCALY